ncbi:hypothetical protein NECAME_08700 [Necator americanus]|uniref:Uncharacterized protein n=1 Tax=Necator americanus TaxID=51031 RepID=W2TGE1_NECAM|nr:hypothetical protein NECAME_08700 [Necator americanus]ETN81115.1 hypothetical protein NECAME_08700 [Necator americanus]
MNASLNELRLGAEWFSNNNSTQRWLMMIENDNAEEIDILCCLVENSQAYDFKIKAGKTKVLPISSACLDGVQIEPPHEFEYLNS